MAIFSSISKTAITSVLAFTLLSGTVGAQSEAESAPEDLPDSFFQVSPSRDKLSVRRPADVLPVFPRLGNPSAPVKIDYFYSHDCEPCAKASQAIYKSLSDGANIEIVFHPLGVDQDSFDAGVAETILYASQPGLFEIFHFGSMNGDLDDPEFDRQALLVDLVGNAADPSGLAARFEYYTDWTDALALNAEFLLSMDAKGLPVLVINDALYTGFVSDEAFQAALETAAALEEQVPTP